LCGVAKVNRRRKRFVRDSTAAHLASRKKRAPLQASKAVADHAFRRFRGLEQFCRAQGAPGPHSRNFSGERMARAKKRGTAGSRASLGVLLNPPDGKATWGRGRARGNRRFFREPQGRGHALGLGMVYQIFTLGAGGIFDGRRGENLVCWRADDVPAQSSDLGPGEKRKGVGSLSGGPNDVFTRVPSISRMRLCCLFSSLLSHLLLYFVPLFGVRNISAES